MIKAISLVIGFLGFTLFTQAQVTLVLRPDANQGKDALLHGLVSEVNVNYGDNPQILCNTFTYNGIEGTVRSIFEFDLSSIPPNSIINSAELSLYAWTETQIGSGQHFGSNAAWIERITSPWDEQTVTWNTQPSTTSLNRVAIPATSSPTQNFPNIDVTQLIQDGFANSGSNVGFMLKQQSETVLRRMNFCSSDYSDSTMRPKLVVVYTPAENVICASYKPNAAIGKDALIHGLITEQNNNFGDNPQFLCNTFTYNGVEGTVRSVIEFDLNAIPANATILSARMSLFSWDDPQLASGNHFGSNAAWIERITSPWDENTVTWNNQPSTTSQNRIAIPETTSPTQSFPNLNVTLLVQDMFANPSSSFGFMMKQQSETILRRMNFCSSDHPNELLRPELEVCYLNNISISENEAIQDVISVYPNPANGHVQFYVGTGVVGSDLKFIDNQGKVAQIIELNNELNLIDLSGFVPGLYFYSIAKPDGNTFTGKIIVK